VQTELTDELRDEGLCRELIHQVQTMRKTANLPYEARIRLYVQGADKLLTVVRRFAEVIESECLAPEIVFQPPPAGVEPWTGQLEGLTATVALVPG
jgi:isoleucyl-tRNA synthetase